MRAATAAAAIALTLALAPSSSPAQSRAARTVALQLRPRVGDVFRTRLDQLVEVTGTTRHRSGDTTVTVRTDLLVLTRSQVEKVDGAGATILAVTDSVLLFTTGSADDWMDQTARRLKGQRLRMRLAPDGGVSVTDALNGDDRELQALVAQMPALLPREPVAVGATWARAMTMPVAGQPEARLGAEVVATFRLDSLVGSLAWISMQGTLQPAKRAEGEPAPAAVSGVVDGYVVVDRKRGWIVDGRTTLSVRSTVAGLRGVPPMKFRMKVVQRLRVY